MKKYLFLLTIIVVFVSCKQEKQVLGSYEIIGTVSGIPNGVRVYIKQNESKGNLLITDTAVIKNGSFFFKGLTEHPLSRGIYINSVRGSIPIIIENGTININVDKDNISKSKITGTKNNELLQVFVTNKKSLTQKRIDLATELRTTNRQGNIDLYDEINSQYSEINDEIINYPFEFIEKYPNSEVSLLALSYELGKNNIELEKFKKAQSQLKNIANRYPENKKIFAKISKYIKQREAASNIEIGKTAPKFSSPNPDEKMLALDDMKGKVTIIDFWAAWCAPCRRENPNVVKVYEKYHDKGLEIIGVSLDGNRRQEDPKDAWLKAIEDDNLTWNHVSSLQYFNDPVAKLYDVQSIPRTFILDDQGKIIAKNLRGQALEDKIAELLD